MSDLNQARRQFKIKLNEKQTVSDAIPALMGRGDGTVIVPNQAGMVYIRVGNEQDYGTAFNNRVSPRDNLPVFVGYDTITDPDRRLFQVLSIRQTAYVDRGIAPIPEVGPHHETHEFGGGDDVYVEWRRIMGLRVGRPAGTMAGVAPITVTVDPGYIYRGTVWILAPVGLTTADLRPAWAALAGTQARLVLISLDSTGAIAQTWGTIVASPAALTIANCPAPPSGNIPLAAIRLYATQSTIGDTPGTPDIIDLRFPTYAAMNRAWDLVGNAGTIAGTNFLGTTDDIDVVFKRNSLEVARLTESGTDPILIVGESSTGVDAGAGADVNFLTVGDGHAATIGSVVYSAGSRPAVAGYRAKGTLAVPLAVAAGDTLLRLGGRGYKGAAWPGGSGGVVDVVAAEAGATGEGTVVQIGCTPIGSTYVLRAVTAQFDTAIGIKNVITDLYTTKNYTLTAAKTGTLPVGTGTANHVTFWQDANQIEGFAPNDALNLILPSQAGMVGNVLGTDGANTSWVASGTGGTVIIANLPCGAMIDWSANAIPSGWLECDGSAVNRITYADLFALIGETYGPGDGVNTFNLPNVKSRVIVGRGQGSGLTDRVLAATGGEEEHQLTEAELPEHSHEYNIYELAGLLPLIQGGLWHNTGATYIGVQSTSEIGSDDSHENMPPFLVLVKIIKYTNAAVADIIFDDGANPEDVSMAAAATGADNYAARRDHVHLYTLDWPAGNVIYVPLSGDIQTYINAATAGDTLILASGEYVITSTITVNKQLNIMGQGNAGFYSVPYAAEHGTVISSVTGAVTGFHITSSNVRIAHMSINLSGAASTAIDTANNLTGIVFTNIDAIVVCSGLAQGFMLFGSNAVFRNLTFYIESTLGAATGLYFYNDGATTQNAICDCFTVTGITKGFGGGSDNWCYLAENHSAFKLTLNLSQSVCRALAGTGLDVGVASVSFGDTNNSIVNAYFCTLEGQDYDVYQDGTNQLNIGGSVLVNNLVFGTVTYRAAMSAGLGVFSSTVVSKQIAAGGIGLDHNSATGNFTLWLSPANLTANRRVIFPDADLTISATAASTLALAIAAGKTLTLTATDDYGLAIPATGRAVLWLGAAATGAIVADPTAGNARGNNSVDLQTKRTNATDVASGIYSAILCGSDNGASGLHATAFGERCFASGVHSIAIGYRSVISVAYVNSFLFADSTAADFNAISSNEFAVRASGGFRHAYDDTHYWTAQCAATGVTTFATLPVGAGFVFTPPVEITGDLTLAGGDIIAKTATTWNLLNTVATTINLGGACTTLNLGAASCVINGAGGITINGGIAANDDITIQGTSHATRTTSYVLLQPTAGLVAIGPTTPVYRLDVVSIASGDTINMVAEAGGYAQLGFSNAANSASVMAITQVPRSTSYDMYFSAYNGATRATKMIIGGNGNVVIGTAALATNATDGFLYIPSCAGAPTGAPTAYTGRVPIVFDSSNDAIYIYSGSWKHVHVA